jgi:hypothetical protein
VLKLDTKRKHVFEHSVGEDTYSFTFEFKCAEDLNYSELRKKINSSSGEVTLVTEEGGKKVEQKVDSSTFNAFIYLLRTSLISWSDNIVDEDEKPLDFSELNQKVVFEYIKSQEDLYEKVLTAFGGNTGKN